MELCRQSGALADAAKLVERQRQLDPDDPAAEALSAIFQRRPARPRPADQETWPTPFVRLTDFLPVAVHDEILATALGSLPAFKPAVVYSEGVHEVRPGDRWSLVMQATQAFAPLLIPALKQALADHRVGEVLGVDPATLQRFELEATCHGGGAFFKAHTDSGEGSLQGRLVSFVYYFHALPRRFRGGDLVVYDGAPELQRYSHTAFTRVEPLDNSLIFFPSDALHAVEHVETDSDDPADGRFSLNGWIRAKPAV